MSIASSVAGWAAAAVLLVLAPHRGAASVPIDPATLQTFGTAGKAQRILSPGHEAVLFQHEGGPGCLTHMWFGGNFRRYGETRIRIYVDGEKKPSIDFELYLGHGIGFDDDFAPWGTARIGKTGQPSGVYDTYRIPFGRSIRVTAQLPPGDSGKPRFWWIIRGTTGLPVEVGGVRLPTTARLHLYKVVDHVARPLEEVTMADVPGDGALYEVTIAARALPDSGDPKRPGGTLNFMEGCVRAYLGGARKPLLLSSGLEDYFLGTYYFNRGRYATPVAGVTHLDRVRHEFSGYRFHDEDPVFFHHGLRLTVRCGDTVDGRMVGHPTKTRYTTYVWIYQWPEAGAGR